MSFSTARTAAAIFVAGSLVCLLQGCGSTPSTATGECNANPALGLKKGCSVTITCSDPVTAKASSECPDKALAVPSVFTKSLCETTQKTKGALEAVATGYCAQLVVPEMPSHESVLTDAMSDNMDESASGALEEKAFYMLLGGFIVAALYLAVRGVLACRGTQEARTVKTAMEQTEMPQLSVTA
mmetsp:Transcript_94595/g.197616  ORF Transcript_94595/g.197616 Transcript_94595/m.197616 type:complete len:184 (-) Transcript_94595:350-901(-)